MKQMPALLFGHPFLCWGYCSECDAQIVYAVSSFRMTYALDADGMLRRIVEPVYEWLQQCKCI